MHIVLLLSDSSRMSGEAKSRQLDLDLIPTHVKASDRENGTSRSLSLMLSSGLIPLVQNMVYPITQLLCVG